MNNFIQRTLSAVVYSGVVLASILVNPVFFGMVFLVVTALALREYHSLLGATIRTTLFGMSAGVLLFAAVYFYMTGDALCDWLFWAYMLVLAVAMIRELFVLPADPMKHWGELCAGQLMIALPLSLMTALLHYDKYLLLSLFIIIWINDSGAYIVGSLMGKRSAGNHKMFPRVSPAKSWEGLIGGLLFDLVAAYVFYRVGWMDALCLTGNLLIDSMIFALVVGVFGTLGDLMESLFKRHLGVKDSGRFLPGHGGVLDRFDSLLLAVPAVYFLVVFLGRLLH